MVKKRLSDEEIDNSVIRSSLNLSSKDATTLKRVSETTWFRSYAKKSKKALNKLTAKVKKGIKHGRFSYEGGGKAETESGFEMPKVKKQKGKKKEKQVVKQAKPKMKKESERKYTPKTKQRVESASKKYPNASNYELRHGVNSKASQQYRLRHGGKREYE